MAQERPTLVLGSAFPWVLSTFSVSALFLGMMLAEVVPAGHGALSGGIGLFILSSGLIQGIASLLAIMAGATVVGLLFGTFAGFWISLGFLLFGLENGWILSAAAEQGVPALGDALGAFALVWAVVIFVWWIASFRLPLAFWLLLGTLWVMFAFAAGGWWTATDELDNTVVNIGGWILIAGAAQGFYLVLSETIVATGGKPLPLGPTPTSLFGLKW